MPPLLLELWREQHPEGHEQTVLKFKRAGAADSAWLCKQQENTAP